MAEELSVISASCLTEVSAGEVNALIDKIVDSSKENMEEICELTLECTTLLSSAESQSNALSNQSVFKRLIGNFTGKNQKMQNAILQDNTNALYAAQGIINRVMRECTNNRKLMIAVNNRVSDIYLELKENQNDIAAAVLMTRQAIVTFFKKYQEEYLEQAEKIRKLEELQKTYCNKCNTQLLGWQRVCPKCGALHPLKQNISNNTKDVLKKISKVIMDNSVSDEFIWDETAKKTERVLRKAKMLANMGKIPGFTDELVGDIDSLIAKCKTAEFQIAIVGVMKAGKSFLMNALMGAEIASTEVNPETAALTKFRSTKGFYLKVKFHNSVQWNRLKNSAMNNREAGKDSLKLMLEDPITIKLEKEWVGHSDININCENLDELKKNVKKYTSSQSMEHLFVAEVEVGVDKNLFNMPAEVVFVDTPGLKDPVKYRSEITRAYIKKADAVLIAVPTVALTTEGNEIITTVLDCTDARKAYIVATQKDLKDSDEDCEKILSLWIKILVNSKRYINERTARSRIVLTSAKMDLLVNKWVSLSEVERNNPMYFSNNDYSVFESYVKRVLGARRYNIDTLAYDEEAFRKIVQNAGIGILRKRLEDNLISKCRELKINDIKDSYIHCKKQLSKISYSAIEQQEQSIRLAEEGADALRMQVELMNVKRKSLETENNEIRRAAESLQKSISREIAILEGKEA